MNLEDFKFWKSNKSYPDFWKTYAASCKQKKSSSYVVFDCETTGLNIKKDVILSIGGVLIKNKRILVAHSFEWYIKQTYFDPQSVKIHGIVQDSSTTTYKTESQAVMDFLKLISNCVLVGHQISFDIAMVNAALERMKLPSLKNKRIDTNTLYRKKHHCPDDMNYSLDELCKQFKISTKARHSALGDAYLTALVFQRLNSM